MNLKTYQKKISAMHGLIIALGLEGCDGIHHEIFACLMGIRFGSKGLSFHGRGIGDDSW